MRPVGSFRCERIAPLDGEEKTSPIFESMSKRPADRSSIGMMTTGRTPRPDGLPGAGMSQRQPESNSPGDEDRVAWMRAAMTEYEGPLVRYARRITGDLETAREVSQDTFLKLWKTDRTQVDGRLAEWLYTVCRNRALDVVRKERRMTRLTEPQAEAAAAGEIHSPNGSSQTPTPEGRHVMLTALARLPERQQEVLRLKFQGDLSYKEIAGVMGLSVSNVGFLIHTGLKSLREIMHVQPG